MRHLTFAFALAAALAAAGAASPASVGGAAPDGTRPLVDMPGRLYERNIDSPAGSGQGCCVFRSTSNAALWQNVPELRGFPEWLRAKRLSGGGSPGNFGPRLKALCKERGVPEPAYVMVTAMDLGFLRAALASRRMVIITYSASPTGRYRGGRIAHMVNLVHLDDKWAAIMDNNDPYFGEGKIEWMSIEEFRRACAPGWAICLLNPPPPLPPPPPHPKE